MPVWLLIIQGLVPLIKTVVDLIRDNPPHADATAEVKDLHSEILASAEQLHTVAMKSCQV